MTATRTKRPITIGDYTIDASLHETHTHEADVTEFPVEQGSPISDNVRNKPIEVQIDGIVSDTPLPPIAATREVETAVSDSPPSVNALATLLAIRDAREPVTISTAVKSYDNMALKSLEVTRDGDTGDALRFTATFVQIVIVATTRATIAMRTSRPQDKKKKDAGKFSPSTITPSGILVISLGPDADPREVNQYSSLYGPYVLEDAAGFHFRVIDRGKVQPDGFVGQDNKYYPLNGSLSAVAGGPGAAFIPETANGNIDPRAVSYDQSTSTWIDDHGLPVTADPPAGVEGWKFPDP